MKFKTLVFVVLGIATAATAYAASESGGPATKGRVLLVASSTDTLRLKEGKKDPTGFYLDELAVPARRLIAEGYDVVVATPNGKKPVMDKTSVQISLFDDRAELDKALHFVATYPSMQHPITLKQAAAQSEQFAAVYVPGGHAPMNDLMHDPDLGRILRQFHEAGKPTAFLCHGPIASLAALQHSNEYRTALTDGDNAALKKYSAGWQYAGYNMTIFSNGEESIIEKDVLHGHVPFYVADALKAAGGNITNGPIWKSYVVRDRELITGQNPQSDKALASELLKALAERSTG
ncbi:MULTISPECIES: type 1 glutamine amidotransferase domain-containing protein [unclassified Burkholderia]|uniref:type 1 glutamine amidotransferase domain-containing protein n=1 Tax=unclassified Burkholderia TaxID=2613784 RepID=UPI000F56A227|nr:MULTISPECIES: type 1 glutamine amidotransferase domain-containing protein [unclassified Burkholderia]RQS26837.1 type 1 glutamine amidotransferase domain-containing protein [Burkholderia sp. Bp8995]RQS51723.1 type 1 glutamine amidotransferase domain-containing protein [Burkholderia sp. Bp8989]